MGCDGEYNDKNICFMNTPEEYKIEGLKKGKMTDIFSPHIKGPQPFDPKTFLVYNAWPTTDLNGMIILWHMMLN